MARPRGIPRWPALGLALLLAACGFEPLYGARDGADRGGGRLAVAVAPIPEREGQTMRTALRRAFDDTGAPDYRMAVTMTERIETTAVDARGDAIRKRMTVAARWRLEPLDVRRGAAPIEGDARVFEGFNVQASEFANLTAERAARLRAAERLADVVAAAATARVRGAAGG